MTTPVLEESRASTGTMRVGIMAGVRNIAVSDVAVPQPGPGEILVRLHATAICTWEQRSCSGAQNNNFPFVGGHESAGDIAAFGAGVTSGQQTGGRVTRATASCGT